MAYTVSNSTKRTLWIVAFLITAWFLLGCGTETCINRDKNSVCIERVSDIKKETVKMGQEIKESLKVDPVSPFAGGHGDGLCATTGKNCN